MSALEEAPPSCELADSAQIETLSLRSLFARCRWQVLTTWFLVVMEAGLMLMFPLAIGIAIDSLVEQEYSGLVWLGLVGTLALGVGAARRFFDTRIYSDIYVCAAEQIVTQERNRDSNVSIVSARTKMANELVEYLENSFPALIDCVIGLAGTLIMVWLLQTQVFIACLIATSIIFAIYANTSDRTLALNKGANDESEQSVKILSEADISDVSSHFRRLVRWNIRLSDLETFTFSLSWLVMLALLLFAVVVTIQSGVTAQGTVLSILMYVFGYIESVIALPLFYQQYVRLREITGRLKGLL
ncbi:MAG: ABC transporter six-transmembrane domain-containing protein [Planctomycetota bacterium]